MKVFVAGATGAIGKRLVPALRSRGHEVTAMTRSPQKVAALRAAGADAVVADALDRQAVARAIEAAQPEVIIHQLTSLAHVKQLRRFDREFASTNQLRTVGTENLVAAARAAHVKRIIAQSYAGWTYEPTGNGLKTEGDPFDPHPPRNQRESLEAIRRLEDTVLSERGMDGVALRYGMLYGPGTNLALDGDLAELVRARKLPIIGSGSGVWSFIHVDDAALAAIVAMERGSAGAYNIVDDEPAPVSIWLPELARSLGAKPPRRIPVWLGRLVGGEVTVSLMTRVRGVSNAKARTELRWTPRYRSWREGFRTGLGTASQTMRISVAS
jgi:nucleoside-diphosphate-sugar epimerase